MGTMGSVQGGDTNTQESSTSSRAQHKHSRLRPLCVLLSFKIFLRKGTFLLHSEGKHLRRIFFERRKPMTQIHIDGTDEWHQTFSGDFWQELGKPDSKEDGHSFGQWREREGWAHPSAPRLASSGLKCPEWLRFKTQLEKSSLTKSLWKKEKVKRIFVIAMSRARVKTDF